MFDTMNAKSRVAELFDEKEVALYLTAVLGRDLVTRRSVNNVPQALAHAP